MENDTIILKVNRNSFKELKNMMHNELKITKEDLERMVSKSCKSIIEKKLNDDRNYIIHPIKQAVEGFIIQQVKKYTGENWYTDKAFEKIIKETFGKIIEEEIKKIVTKELLSEYFNKGL